MIPNKLPKKIEEKPMSAELNKIVEQNRKTAKTTKRKYFISKGDCICCKRSNIGIVKMKPKLCNRCYHFCYNWIKKKYGFYSRLYIGEAIGEFRKPMKCRFFDICGNVIPRMNADGTININRNNICERCFPIYNAGVVAGNSRKRNKWRGMHGT